MARPTTMRLACVLALVVLAFGFSGSAAAEPLTSGGDVSDTWGTNSFVPSGWTSSLYPRDWTPGYADAEGRRIADFSYAGYARGELPIPTKEGSLTVDITAPPFSVSPTSTRNATRKIQAALDFVGQQGGGVVFLPAGRYHVSRPSGSPGALSIRYSDVVLRGAGRGRTLIVNRTTSMSGASILSVQPTSPVGWAIPPVGSLPNLAEDSLAGSHEVKVTNPGQFAVGDLIYVRTEATDAWLAHLGRPRYWTASNTDAATYLRRIERILEDGTLVVDIPFRTDVLLRDRGRSANVFLAGQHLHGVGIEDLSVGNLPHPANRYLVRDTHESSAIKYRTVIDSWISRVSTFKPASSAYHLLSEGIWLQGTKNVSVVGCIMAYPQNRTAGDGNGYVIRGSDNLIDSSAAIRSRHAYSLGLGNATGNVVRRSVSARPLLSSDFHMWFSAVNLLEDMYLDGDSIDASFRNSGAYRVHGPTTSESIIWNTRGVRYRVGQSGAPLVNSIQHGWGAVIGTVGTPTRVSFDPRADGTYGDRTIDLVEGVGEAPTLLPNSLYADQVRRRLVGVTADVLATGTILPATSERLVRKGATAGDVVVDPVQTLNVGDRILYTFDVRSAARIERARLVMDGRVGRGATTFSVRARSSTSPDSTSITLRNLVRTRNAPPTWVTDVSDVVRQRTSGGAKTLTFEIARMSGTTPAMLRTGLDSEPARRPRLELDTAPALELTATVLPTSRSAAADGLLHTYYSRSSLPSVVLDLGSVRRVRGVGVAFGGGNRYSSFADVWTSVDGLTWKPAGSVCGTGYSTSIQMTRLDVPTEARYVQFRGVFSSRTDYPDRVTFHELEVYGD